MKRILYTILMAAVILVGNYFFSNGTLDVRVETPVSTVTPIAVIPTQVASLENTCGAGYHAERGCRPCMWTSRLQGCTMLTRGYGFRVRSPLSRPVRSRRKEKADAAG